MRPIIGASQRVLQDGGRSMHSASDLFDPTLVGLTRR